MNEDIMKEILKIKEEFGRKRFEVKDFNEILRGMGNLHDLEKYKGCAIKLAAMALYAAECAENRIKSEEKPVMVSITDINQLGKRNE